MTDGDLEFLLELHKMIGAQICEHMGHDWTEVSFSEGSVNTLSVERCTRCRETREPPLTSTSTNNSTTLDVRRP